MQGPKRATAANGAHCVEIALVGGLEKILAIIRGVHGLRASTGQLLSIIHFP